MPTQITISSLSGSSPFDVYACDTGYTTCIYINTITPSQIPYTFNLPPIMESLEFFDIKVVDNNDCVLSETLT